MKYLKKLPSCQCLIVAINQLKSLLLLFRLTVLQKGILHCKYAMAWKYVCPFN